MQHASAGNTGFLLNLRGWPCKIAFVVLSAIPFLPAIVLHATSRCLVYEQPGCLVGAKSVREFVAAALEAASLRGAGFNGSIATGWLIACYLAASFSWGRTASRLLLAFAVTLIFVIFPYFIPLQELGIADNAVHILAIQVWFSAIGVLTAFFIYVVVILGLVALANSRRP